MTKAKKVGGHLPGSHFPAPAATIMASAYSLPAGDSRTDNIADSVCRILDDDSPRPMVRLRPAKKVPNAAEQFYTDHHQPYEAYGARSRDKMEAVRAHNAAYPQMHDELRRKRSMAKITTNFAQRHGIAKRTAHTRCGTCRSRKEGPKKRGPTKFLPKETRKRIWPIRSNITKPKARQQRTGGQRFSKMTSTKRILACQTTMAVERGTVTSRNLLNIGGNKCKSSHSEDGSSKNKNPDTDASLSSYNSYASLEHEPMVAE